MPDNTLITVTLHAAIDRVIETPHLAVGAHINARERTCYPGGKGVNVAATLDRLGIPNTATGFVGESDLDLFNNRLCNACFVAVDGPTRVNLTLIDPQANTDLHLRFEGCHITAADLGRLGETLDELTNNNDSIVAFCGSLPPGMGIDALLGLIDRVQQRGARVAVDLSGEALRQAVAQGCWLVKPNEQELAQISGQDGFASEEELIVTAKTLQPKVQHIVITRGEEASLWIGPDGIWRGYCKVAANRIVNTVGCGDCFLGGLLGGFASSPPLDVQKILRMALSTATANALGAGVADFTAEQIESLQPHCHIEPAR